eukprot:CCRYP_002011-RB/>CCRYP_002011-RB protein AED:0.04 eAED:0.04 QI:412/1/1/1/0.83/0.85/7/239/1584
MKRASPHWSPEGTRATMKTIKKSNTQEKDFIFRSPFKPQQQAQNIQTCLESIHRDLEYIQYHGYDEFTKRRATYLDDDADAATKDNENLGSAFNGTLRDYQQFMLERAKKRNTIVHLGTGMGKTLIAIMLIKEFLGCAIKGNVAAGGTKSQILFLVPSIALAVQHTDSLRANLPCKVETACHTSSRSARARESIAAADVVVATHGSALDLLNHYQDILSLTDVSLLVIDECHYATGDHNYATILRKYYHPLKEGKRQRPRILGLTASPLINVSIRTNEEKLQSLLSEFESIMDSRLVGFPSDHKLGNSSFSNVEQKVVGYESREIVILPNQGNWKLHWSRKNEINQLQYLCNEVGLRVTAAYVSKLAREVSRNEFDQETSQQCENLKSYLIYVENHLNELIAQDKAGPYGGHTDKMRKLECLLTTVLKEGSGSMEQTPVGIVFVKQRITAIALCNYFRIVGNEQARSIDEETRAQKPDSDNHTNKLNECTDESNVFEDAENDNSMDFTAFHKNNAQTILHVPEKGHAARNSAMFRCDFVVRRATHIFKYMNKANSLDKHQLEELEDDWLHQMEDIRSIIGKLRLRETNVLFATSIVEEGVDVEACSFVISFDALQNVKSFIQMKGRARQKDARFFVFADSGINKQHLTLENASSVETMVYRFIAKREVEYIREFNSSRDNFKSCLLGDEEAAMHRELYTTSMSSVDLSSSKSLLNRYSLSVPIDPSNRTSKQAISLHMPLYKDHSLVLPTHIPPDMRVINLPSLFNGESRKKKHSLMALAACVRLHRLGLLNDRLLPLSDADMKSWLIENALNDIPPCEVIPLRSSETPRKSTPIVVYLYKLTQYGKIFNEEENSFSSGDDKKFRLALASLSPLPDDFPILSYHHSELGCIECNVSFVGHEQLSEYQWDRLTDFHCVVFNARWRRKSKPRWFSFDDDLLTKHRNPYVIGCLDSNDEVHWRFIDSIINDFSRSEDSRKKAVRSYDSKLISPRVCCPIYNPTTAYILYEASGKKSEDEFATSEFKSFREYYATKYALKINPQGKMFRARRIWEFPQSSNTSDAKPQAKRIPFIDIPQELCSESIVADPLLILHLIVLPQLLYKLERFLTVLSLIKHATSNYPTLGKCLSTIPVDSITEALTAKSCCEATSYDRLEWLGDAVLKLLHTDALLKWKRTSFLHEGYLSLLRSAMGSNERLCNCAKITGIADFILLAPLTRAEWKPCGLRHLTRAVVEDDDNVRLMKPSDKVCADVIESLIGIIFLHHGIHSSMSVACELGISFNYGDADDTVTWSDLSVDSKLIDFAASFLGVERFQSPQLLVEATTHQSCLHKPVPSYQRLEWIGDAVLCLAIREWLFRFDAKLAVPRLVVLEATLECNESLAFLGFKEGLCKFIDHRDSRLPNRFENFQRDLEKMERGLWCTVHFRFFSPIDPPKVISDVVEALLGAAHVDLGFAQGQKAALHVIRPILQSICSLTVSSDPSWNVRGILHPKQHLYQMTGGIVRVRAYKGDKFRGLGIPWFCSEGNKDNEGYIGVVSCKGLTIAAVWESSSRAAINVSCSLAVDLLAANPHILDKLRDFHLISKKYP